MSATKLRWVYRPSVHENDIDGGCPGFCEEGYVFDCIDGCCVDAESGCDLCASRCEYCWVLEPAPTTKGLNSE